VNARRRAIRAHYGPPIEAPKRTSRPHKSYFDIPYCREVYDDVHLRKWGYGCMNKHRAYSWPALHKEDYLLIGDSIVKFINHVKYMRVMAFPGATAKTILGKYARGEIDSRFHEIVILAIGTNDVTDVTRSVSEVVAQIMELIDIIRAGNPWAMLVFSAMLIRPKDIGTIVEQRRKLANKRIEWACKDRGVQFMRSWKSLMNGSFLKDRVYARDGLHLNRFGARYLYRHMESTLKNVEGLMKL
jgi:hypothetical protein